jgi:hypothetical protein
MSIQFVIERLDLNLIPLPGFPVRHYRNVGMSRIVPGSGDVNVEILGGGRGWLDSSIVRRRRFADALRHDAVGAGR